MVQVLPMCTLAIKEFISERRRKAIIPQTTIRTLKHTPANLSANNELNPQTQL